MKKIISIIAVFILGMGIVSAQTAPTFSYQSVVVDINGDLVVNTTVNVVVNITYGVSGSYTETSTVTTSANGMAVIPIGGANAGPGFNNIDWKTASINLTYSASGRDFDTPQSSRVEGVPYAIQSEGFDLTTQAITNYLNNPGTSIDDMYALLAAIDNNPNHLGDSLKRAIIQYAISNHAIAKQIMLAYIQQATPQDVHALYDTAMSNTEGLKAFKRTTVEYFKLPESKERVVEVLMSYSPHLTVDELDTIYYAIPEDVLDAAVAYGLQYMLAHKVDVVYPVIWNYLENITPQEFEYLIQKIETNPTAFQKLHDQFYVWMDEYFQGGGSDYNRVMQIIQDSLAARNWIDPNCNVDLCKLIQDVEALEAAAQINSNCPSVGSNTFTLTIDNGYFKGSFPVTGTPTNFNGVYYSSNGSYNQTSLTSGMVTFSNQTVDVAIPVGATLNSGETLTVEVIIEATNCTSITVTGTYTQP